MVPSCWPVAKRLNNRQHYKGSFLHQPFTHATSPSYHRPKNHDTLHALSSSVWARIFTPPSSPDTLAVGFKGRELSCNSESVPVVSHDAHLVFWQRARYPGIVCRVLRRAEPALFPGTWSRMPSLGSYQPARNMLTGCQDASASLPSAFAPSAHRPVSLV